MKKSKLIFAISLLSLTACGGMKKHSYTIQTIDSEYLVHEATCTESAVYYYHCECGATDSKYTFEYGDPLGHDYVSNENESTSTCSRCGDTIQNSELTYETNYYDNYYASILSWENGEDLKNKLYTILHEGYTPLEYDTPNWETNQYADQALDDFEKVNVVYSSVDDMKEDTYKSGSGWQREHAFAASLMTGYISGEAVVGKGRATDFHNLYASYLSGNTSRGNKNFGIADPSDAGYQGVKSDKAGRGDYKCDTKNFEPSDEDKGKLARSIFYMGVMYSDTEANTIKVKNGTKSFTIEVTYKPLQIIEEYVNYSKVTYANWVSETPTDDVKSLISTYGAGVEGYAKYSTDSCQFAIGNLSTLLDWSDMPVTRIEYQHNESVYSHIFSGQEVAQGNRNPFTDYPELVDYVYGDKKEQSGELKYLKPSCLTLNVEGSKKSEVANYAIKEGIREFEKEETFDKDSLTIVKVKNDFSYEETDEIAIESYTFTDADAKLGQKAFTIKTPLNTLTYVVAVKGNDISSCCYSHTFVADDIKKHVYTTAKEYSFSNVNWMISAATETSASNTSDKGMKIGGGTTSTPPAGTIHLETSDDFVYEDKNLVNAVYVKANAASGANYTMVIKVGNVTSSPITISYNASESIVYGLRLASPVSGKVSIEISNITKAVYLDTIAVNAISQ